MPQHHRDATFALYLIAGLVVPGISFADVDDSLSPDSGGSSQLPESSQSSRRGLFSTPLVAASYARTIQEEGEGFLALKKAAFDQVRREGGFVLIAPETRVTAPDGSYLLELRGYFDSLVTATVDYDSGAGYDYAVGDELRIRLYSAILFDISSEGVVRGHLYKPLALQNMSNPRNRDEQFTSIKRIAAQEVFSATEREGLLQPGEDEADSLLDQ